MHNPTHAHACTHTHTQAHLFLTLALGRNSTLLSPTAVKLDGMGPVVVNKDGTVSRITNWHSMTEAEQQKTLFVLGKRNKQRLEVLRGQPLAQPAAP